MREYICVTANKDYGNSVDVYISNVISGKIKSASCWEFYYFNDAERRKCEDFIENHFRDDKRKNLLNFLNTRDDGALNLSLWPKSGNMFSLHDVLSVYVNNNSDMCAMTNEIDFSDAYDCNSGCFDLDKLKLFALNGDVNAIFTLGILYTYGLNGLEKDTTEGDNFLLAGSALGDVKSQLALVHVGSYVDEQRENMLLDKLNSIEPSSELEFMLMGFAYLRNRAPYHNIYEEEFEDFKESFSRMPLMESLIGILEDEKKAYDERPSRFILDDSRFKL